MSGELEAAGALATAGLVAGAIERPGPGEAGQGRCLNCQAELGGRYCANCGQSAHPHRTLWGVIEEFLHGLLHFDAKAWRTLPMVIVRPGTLTRNWVFGKRARYISPLALFLFTIFFMFFAFAFIDAPELGSPEQQRAAAAEQLQQARASLARAEAALAETGGEPGPAEGAEAGQERLRQRLAEQAVSLARAEVLRQEQALARRQTRAGTEPSEDGSADAESGEPGARASESWQEQLARAAREGRITMISFWPELNDRMVKKLENPDLALYKVQQTGYKFSFLLAPLSLPFIALLFLWKRGVTFYDHVVYALYALSFASILFVTIIVASKSPLTSWTIGWLLGLGLPVHTFFHLKGAYGLGWFSALWRTLFMLTFALIILSLFVLAIFLLGLGAG